MGVEVKVRVGGGPSSATDSQRRDALRAAMRTVGLMWHREYKPLKFRNSATRRYDLKPRMGERGSPAPFRGSYTQKKLKKFGHTRPFEWSGKSRQSAMASNRVIAKATSSKQGRCEAIVVAPKFNRSVGQRINLREEFERVLPEEFRALTKEALRAYRSQLTAILRNRRR